MCTHRLSKLICGMHTWKRYRQMTLSFDDSNGLWEQMIQILSNIFPTTQHHQKGNHGSYFKQQWLPQQQSDRPEAQASHFTPFCLRSFTFSQSSVIYSNNVIQFHYLWTQSPLGSNKSSWKIMKKGQFSIPSPSNLPPCRSPAHTLSYT